MKTWRLDENPKIPMHLHATYEESGMIESSKLDLLVRVHRADPAFIPGLAKLYGIEDSSTEIEKLVGDLNDYCRSVAPVPVSLRDPTIIKPLLDGFRKQREQASQRPTAFYVIFVNGLLFKWIVEGRIETTHSYNECAAFSDIVAARKEETK
jgi:hypothetical protein